MKRVAIFAFPVLIISLASCNNGRSYNHPDTQIESASTSQPVTGMDSTVPAAASSAGNNPINPVSTAAVPNNAQLAINPAHGEPGHRCDIAVGAPIPATYVPNINAPVTPITNQSVPGNPAVTPFEVAPNPRAQQVQPVSQPQAQAAPAKVAAGMNPPHGQPGHRCDIAVGAPLNSKPAATAAPPATIASNGKPASSATPAPATATPQKVAPGMNPAHGQPGHRCDIAVGAPLNSKPAPAATTQQVSPLQPMPVTPVITPPVTAPVKTDSTNNR